MARLQSMWVALVFSGCTGGSGGADPTPTPIPTPTPEPACVREVSGVLAGVTSWDDGPVCVVGDLFLPPSSALGIAPGVEVRFGGRFAFVLQQGSRLSTAGTATAPVLFTSGAETPRAGDWGPILADTGAQITLRGTVMSHGSGLHAFESTVTIEDSTFRANEAAVAPAVVTVESGTLTAHRTAFEENDATCLGLLRSGGLVSHTRFVGCAGAGILVLSGDGDPLPLIRNDLFRANEGAGLHIAGAVDLSGVTRNVFEGNARGIETGNGAAFAAHDNHLLDPLAIRVTGTGASSATNNWWGTTDPAEIAARISATEGHPVEFDPFRLAPVPGAGP